MTNAFATTGIDNVIATKVENVNYMPELSLNDEQKYKVKYDPFPSSDWKTKVALQAEPKECCSPLRNAANAYAEIDNTENFTDCSSGNPLVMAAIGAKAAYGTGDTVNVLIQEAERNAVATSIQDALTQQLTGVGSSTVEIQPLTTDYDADTGPYRIKVVVANPDYRRRRSVTMQVRNVFRAFPQGRRLLGGDVTAKGPAACNIAFVLQMQRMPGTSARCCTAAQNSGRGENCEPLVSSRVVQYATCNDDASCADSILGLKYRIREDVPGTCAQVDRIVRKQVNEKRIQAAKQLTATRRRRHGWRL